MKLVFQQQTLTANMAGVIKTFYHIAAFSWYAFIIQCIYAKDVSDLPPGIFVYGGPWKYLTFLNLVRGYPCFFSVFVLEKTACFVNSGLPGLTDGVFWAGVCE